MLTFYPEFEVDTITDNEIVFMLDLSNSMKVRVWFASQWKVAVNVSLFNYPLDHH